MNKEERMAVLRERAEQADRGELNDFQCKLLKLAINLEFALQAAVIDDKLVAIRAERLQWYRMKKYHELTSGLS